MNDKLRIPCAPKNLDPLEWVVEIVRDAIDAGLIPVSRAEFDHQLKTLKGPELEDYIQQLWDQI